MGAAAPVAAAPLKCAGLVGWRSLKMAGEGRRIGLDGSGAAAHLIAQAPRWQGREVLAFTRAGDAAARALARDLGAARTDDSDETPPEPLDAAILFAPVGFAPVALVPLALRAVRKGGRVVCGGIHTSDLPILPYDLLRGERRVQSVANLARVDAVKFLTRAPRAGVAAQTTRHPLTLANAAFEDLRPGASRARRRCSPEIGRAARRRSGGTASAR